MLLNYLTLFLPMDQQTSIYCSWFIFCLQRIIFLLFQVGNLEEHIYSLSAMSGSQPILIHDLVNVCCKWKYIVVEGGHLSFHLALCLCFWEVWSDEFVRLFTGLYSSYVSGLCIVQDCQDVKNGKSGKLGNTRGLHLNCCKNIEIAIP